LAVGEEEERPVGVGVDEVKHGRCFPASRDRIDDHVLPTPPPLPSSLEAPDYLLLLGGARGEGGGLVVAGGRSGHGRTEPVAGHPPRSRPQIPVTCPRRA